MIYMHTCTHFFLFHCVILNIYRCNHVGGKCVLNVWTDSIFSRRDALRPNAPARPPLLPSVSKFSPAREKTNFNDDVSNASSSSSSSLFAHNSIESKVMNNLDMYSRVQLQRFNELTKCATSFGLKGPNAIFDTIAITTPPSMKVYFRHNSK